MATAADVAAVRARIASHQEKLNTLQGEIDALRAQTVSFNTEGNNAKEATAKAKIYTTDITKKITALETKMNGYYATQRGLIETMAASVLEQATSMVEALRTETKSHVAREVAALNSRITTEVEQLKSTITGEVEILNGRITSEVGTLNGRITSEVGTLNSRIDYEVQTLGAKIDHETAILNERIDHEVRLFDNKIGMVNSIAKQVVKRLDNTRNPVTGEAKPYEGGYVSLLGLHRNDALTAEEYDALDLPAAMYDLYGLEALEFDLYGRLRLEAWMGEIQSLTAGEYDSLELTAESFASYGLSCAQYDILGASLLR